jgi:hypothetical protein
VRYALVLLPVFLQAADLMVDHVTIAGTDLKQMQASLAAMGLRSEFGGQHSNHATEMALTSFPDGSYLELIALQANPDPKSVASHYWSKQMKGNAGPTAWAVRTRDLASEVARLQAAGIAANPQPKTGRERPDGKRLEWETATVGNEPNGTFFPFIIHDFTPREQRAYPTGQPTTQDFRGVTRVVIAVRDLASAIARFRKASSLPVPLESDDVNFGARVAVFPGSPVVLAAPTNGGSWLVRRLEQFGAGPCAFVLGVSNRGRYKTVSKSQWPGVDVSWMSSGWHLGFE